MVKADRTLSKRQHVSFNLFILVVVVYLFRREQTIIIHTIQK